MRGMPRGPAPGPGRRDDLPHALLAALAVLLSLGASPGAAQDPSGDTLAYRFELGLTGDATLRNATARAELVPKLEAIARSIDYFLDTERRQKSDLDDILAQGQDVLGRLPLTPPDDDLTLRTLETVGQVVNLLELFGRRSQALSLSGSLASKLAGLVAAHPWNPVLRAHSQGVAAKRAALAGGPAP